MIWFKSYDFNLKIREMQLRIIEQFLLFCVLGFFDGATSFGRMCTSGHNRRTTLSIYGVESDQNIVDDGITDILMQQGVNMSDILNLRSTIISKSAYNKSSFNVRNSSSESPSFVKTSAVNSFEQQTRLKNRQDLKLPVNRSDKSFLGTNNNNNNNNNNPFSVNKIETVIQHTDKNINKKEKDLIINLDGVTLKQMLSFLVEELGYNTLYEKTKLRCFQINPSLNSSLKVLRGSDMEWARKDIEYLYIQRMKSKQDNIL